MACHIQAGGDVLCDQRHKAHPQEKGHRNFVPCEPKQQKDSVMLKRQLKGVWGQSKKSVFHLACPKGKHVIKAELFP